MTRPVVGRSSRRISRMKVDLPEPEEPMTKTNSPRSISREMSCRAGRAWLGYVLLTFSKLIMACIASATSAAFRRPRRALMRTLGRSVTVEMTVHAGSRGRGPFGRERTIRTGCRRVRNTGGEAACAVSDLVCANCAGPVSEGRCGVCRGQRAQMHHETGGLLVLRDGRCPVDLAHRCGFSHHDHPLMDHRYTWCPYTYRSRYMAPSAPYSGFCRFLGCFRAACASGSRPR